MGSAVRRELGWLVGGSAAGLAAFLAFHWYLIGRLEAEGSKLGAHGVREFLPLHAQLRPGLTLWIVPALLVGLVYLRAAKSWTSCDPQARAVRLIGAVLLFILMAVSVASIDGYLVVRGQPWHALVAPYVRDGLEYFGDVPRIDQEGGLLPFLRRFAKPRLFSTLAVHTQTHPPGGVVFLWGVSKLFGHGLWPAALSGIAFTSLGALAVFGLARRMYGPEIGYPALALLLVVPNTIFYMATSMDGPFTVFPLFSLYVFYRALGASGRRVAFHGLAAGGLFALGTFMTYSTVCLVFFWSALLGLLFFRDRSRFRRALAALSAALLAFAVVWGGLALLGYDVIGSVQASIARDRQMMEKDQQTFGIYLRISVSNLAAFLFQVGLPLSVTWLRAVGSSVRGLAVRREWDPHVLAGAVAVFGAGFSSLFTIETERVWLSMVPLLLVPVAHRQMSVCRAAGSLRPWGLLLALQYLQLLVTEILLYVIW